MIFYMTIELSEGRVIFNFSFMSRFSYLKNERTKGRMKALFENRVSLSEFFSLCSVL